MGAFENNKKICQSAVLKKFPISRLISMERLKICLIFIQSIYH
jgi:hypothetical protein